MVAINDKILQHYSILLLIERRRIRVMSVLIQINTLFTKRVSDKDKLHFSLVYMLQSYLDK